jgi:plastocyanin
MKKVLTIRAAALLFALCFCGCSTEKGNEIPAVAGDKATTASQGPTGRIRGVVRLKGDAPAAQFEPISENQNVCGDKVSVSRLALGKEKGVQYAFVYLDGVQSAQPYRAQQSLLVDQKNCQYAPHSLIVPAGGQIEITNSDPILHNVHGHQLTDQGQQTLFNVAQPVRGQRSTVATSLTPGIVYLTCEAGHPWMSGYVFVANHPYVTVSGADGEFVIDGVPPGTYRLKMWHEGVILKQNIKSLQRYEYEDPYEETQDVTVQANGETVVNFDLVLRSGT